MSVTLQATPGRAFVSYVIEKAGEDKGLAAALRRADNPATQYQSWAFLLGFHIDIEKDWKRVPYAAIAAAVARSKQQKDGSVPFMKALAQVYPEQKIEDKDKGPAAARLRRLLACTSAVECCSVLRPMFALVRSKGADDIDYGGLLDDLLWFDSSQERIKARWATDFYQAGRSK